MAWLRPRRDPIAAHERALNQRIALLQDQIRGLQQRLAEEQTQPKLRSTAVPKPTLPATPPATEPRFEEVNHQRVQHPAAPEEERHRYNELGLRKYDPFAGLRRLLTQFRSQPSASPKLVNYLAAGSIHGLRPLRYEKRLARNWFLIVCAFFIVMFWGLIYFYFRHR